MQLSDVAVADVAQCDQLTSPFALKDDPKPLNI